MENDDALVGRILSRREALALLGAASAATLIAACAPTQTLATPTAAGSANAEAQTAAAVASNPTAAATAQASASTAVAANATTLPSCVVRPSLTEGPYFVDDQLNRSDIRTEPSDNSVRPGIPLALTFNVSKIANSECTPLEGAQVDVWHCDVEGEYSGVSDRGFTTTGQKWLRGFQLTDANGVAAFTTIYPGWYSGRTTHIHFKIRTPGLDNATYEFTSQLFFDEALTKQVYGVAPYASKGQKDTPNSTDGIFSDQMLLAVSGDLNGFATKFDIALDLTDTEAGASDAAGGQGGPGGGGPPPNGGGQPSATP